VLAGKEGAFLVRSFWPVDAYLALRREKEARELFERLVGRANDVGLVGEKIDTVNDAFVGNIPQAFTHLALIGNAINLGLYQKGRPGGGRWSPRQPRAPGRWRDLRLGHV
jgi:GH15 family glucan-1,4-alpha-glucosidase